MSPVSTRTASPPSSLADVLQRGYRYALSLAHDRERAADLVQDACVGISRRGGPWQLPYLLRAIRNRHIDLHRRRGLHLVSLEDSGAGARWAGDAGALAAVTLGDPGLEEAMRLLEDDQREMLYLSVVEGWTAAEIAKLTGRPRGTVLSTLSRAKARLRSALAAAGRGGEAAGRGGER